ncbi:GGDEF domain-containing protein [Marinobacter caseinilyticus]|uniref:GGDEF domain-containing protein n=1 Tax=Marinobacter caseinilyticus TaxID=2692195 RepID=UPI00140743F2|nr:GGDEF domain-containing protein [Marinobacter caseinilyticus]
MTETRLRTFTHLAGYGLATLFIITLASQNLRYGFYELFYLAVGLALLTTIGGVYTLISRRQQLRAPGHVIILALVNAAVVAALFSLDRPDISYWCLPALLLNMLILPLRQGLVLSLCLSASLTVYLLSTLPLAEALLTVMAALLILSAASLYIWHYNHMAQSAEDLAITDPVTGAHNARFLDETLQKEISRANVTGHSLSVILLGIDYVSEAEDLHGEAGMQNLFKQVTEQLFDVIRAGDTLYALGNGEFFLILPFTPEEGVRVIAERVRRTLGEHRWPIVSRMTVSLGCTTRGASDTRSDTLRGRTLHALNEARKRGHDTIWYSRGDGR